MSAANTKADLHEETPVELQELLRAVESLPAPYREGVMAAATRVVDGAIRRRRILNLVQEALSQLRLDMKYLVFDLEATRRERDALQQRLRGDSTEGNE